MSGQVMSGKSAAPHQGERGTATRPITAEPKSGGAPEMELEPEEIRAIRKLLGLSQAEAGDLLGGGPRAFTKYEAGTVKPTAAVVTLLRLLERDPATIRKLQAIKSLPMTPMPEAASPFQIAGEHIARLNELLFPQFLRRLLHAEAQAHDLPTEGIHVSDNIHAPDGGEDGRIEWQGGPERTLYLPSRINQFQLKSGQVTPAKAASDVLQNGKVKPMVRRVLEAGGHYRMLCAHPYAKKAIEGREHSIREAIRKAGVSVNDSQIAFWDAGQIAAWANQHPAVAIWVKEKTQPGTISPFRSWTHWADHPNHANSPWVEDERLPPLRDHLRTAAMTPQCALRLVGLAGIGKSRLALEALGPLDDDPSLKDMVLYANESEADTNDIFKAVQALADNRSRAVVVVNHCCPKTHRILVGMVSRSSSRLSLLTLDDEIPGTFDETTIKVEEAPPAIVEAIIDQTLPNLPSEDRRRLVHFSKGFPRIAIDVAQAWKSSKPIAHVAAEDLVESFILGRQPREPERTLKSAMLVAAFGMVAVEPDDDQLKEVSAFGRGLTADDLRVGIGRLVERGIVRRRGRLRILQPRPIAMQLAERQWKEWSKSQHDRILTGCVSPPLKITAARVLARLNTNTTAIANEVVRHVCRRNGLLTSYEALARPGQAEVLSSLAEVLPATVLEAMERCLGEVDDLLAVKGDVRRHIVWALEKITFDPDTFEGGARLLLRLAVAENETWSNNASGLFAGIFRTRLGNTAANGNARLALLDEISNAAKPEEQLLVVAALTAGLETMVSRMVGAETHGSKPALSSWLPPSRDAEVEYVTGCISRLASIGAQGSLEPLAVHARKELGQHLRSLVCGGYINAAEEAVRQVAPVVSNWSAAMESLGLVLEHDAAFCGPQVIERVKKLLADLQPKSLDSRIHFLVTAMPRNYPFGEKPDLDEWARRQEEALRELAVALAQEPDILEEALPKLSRGDHRKASIFGEVLSQLAGLDSPEIWLDRIIQAAVDAPDANRNLDLLCGYCIGFAKSHLEMAKPIKERLTQSPILSPAFPSVCARLGLAPSDIQLAVDALGDGLLPPSQLALGGFSGALERLSSLEVIPLFDALLEHGAEEVFAIALNLIHTYLRGSPEAFDSLRPQIRRCVEKCASDNNVPNDTMDAFHFERLTMQMLEKGREDADACAIALDLAKLMVTSSHQIGKTLPNPLIHRLLSDFPEIVWPCIGATIVSDPSQSWLMAHVLGRSMGFRKQDPPILSLPEVTLRSWCHAHPDQAPEFVARVVPVLAEGKDSEKTMHPLLRWLIDEFGERKKVLDAIGNSINSFSWTGSLTRYYGQYIDPISALTDHETATVRRWAHHLIRQLRAMIEQARDQDSEEDAEWEI